MAKKIQGGTVEYKATSKGLDKVEKDAKKAGKGLDKAGTSAHSADRRLKGAAQASSNTTKNFSKMAQGITGGLVPAYATLAANLFALDAVFRFLKSSADFRVLKEGQLAFAAATGVAYESLARDIQLATRNMINFKDAAQAGAIGRAAGLSATQLNQLSEAAFTVSIALGRDVTDSFNRLVRGVTKAEPELLDELGIVLRLEEATTKYAAALGLNKNQLSIYQKSQAVVNEVLGQAERKFGKINAIMEPNANSISQLGVAFEESIDKIRMFIAPFVEGVASIMAKDIQLVTLAVIGFGSAIIKSVIPSTEMLIQRQEEMAAQHIARQEQMKRNYEDLAIKKKMLANTPMEQISATTFAKDQGFLDQIGGKGGEKLRSGGTLTGRELGGLKSVFARNASYVADMTEDTKKMWGGMIDNMIENGGELDDEWSLKMQKMKLDGESFFMPMQQGWDNMVHSFDKGMASVMTWVSRIMGAVAIISIAWMVGKAVWNWLNADHLDKVAKYTERLNELSEAANRVNAEMSKMNEVLEAGLLYGAEKDIFIGEMLASSSMLEGIKNLENLRHQSHLAEEEFLNLELATINTMRELEKADSRFKKFREQLELGRPMAEWIEGFKALRLEILDVMTAQKQLIETTSELIKAQNRLVQSLPKLPYQDIIELLEKQVEAYTTLIDAGKQYEGHLLRVALQIELFKEFQDIMLQMNQYQRNLDFMGAAGFLRGDSRGTRALKVEQARQKVVEEIHKFNDGILGYMTAQVDADSVRASAIERQLEAQGLQIEQARRLYELEKLRQNQMFMTYNTLVGQFEDGLKAAISGSIRGDDSGWEKIGDAMAKTISDAMANYLVEQWMSDIGLGALSPETETDRIMAGADYHAALITQAIRDGAFIHADQILGSGTKIADSFNSVGKQLNTAMNSMGQNLTTIVNAMMGAEVGELTEKNKILNEELVQLGKDLKQAKIVTGPESIANEISRYKNLEKSGNLLELINTPGFKRAESMIGREYFSDGSLYNSDSYYPYWKRNLMATLGEDDYGGAYSGVASNYGKIPVGKTFTRGNYGSSDWERYRHYTHPDFQHLNEGERPDWARMGVAGTHNMPIRGMAHTPIQGGQEAVEEAQRKALDDVEWFQEGKGKKWIDNFGDWLESQIGTSGELVSEIQGKIDTITAEIGSNTEKIKALGGTEWDGSDWAGDTSDKDERTKEMLKLAFIEAMEVSNWDGAGIGYGAAGVADASSTSDPTKILNPDGSVNQAFIDNFNGTWEELLQAFKDAKDDVDDDDDDKSDGFSNFKKGVSTFGTVVGAYGVLAGEEEKTAKLMAKVAKLQMAIVIAEQVKLGLEASMAASSNPIFAFFKAFFGFGRYGGVFSPTGKSFATGGIAQGPTSGYGAVLHGTEAVVPLGNDRSIPVKMQGGGQQINTTINVSADGAVDTTSDEEQGRALGQAIQVAVLEEISKQQRPGGVLAG